MKLTTMIAAAVLSLAAFAVNADDNPYRDGIDDTPSAAAMAFDLVVIRPVSLIVTVLGAGLFVAQLPLSVVMGEPPSAPAKRLVVEPAQFTFTRPLGEMN